MRCGLCDQEGHQREDHGPALATLVPSTYSAVGYVRQILFVGAGLTNPTQWPKELFVELNGPKAVELCTRIRNKAIDLITASGKYAVWTEDDLFEVYHAEPLPTPASKYLQQADTADWLSQQPLINEKPQIVCLIGSSLFTQTFREEWLKLSAEGAILVSTIPLYPDMRTRPFPEQEKLMEEVNEAKIRMAERVHVLNTGNILTVKMKKEIALAHRLGKRVTYSRAMRVGCTS